ncbi:MAG: carbon-nitrogen hydrolase family protein [Chthoniobacterales bacterium]
MRVAAAQISCVPGDRDANLRKVRDFCERAKNAGAELIVFPEMTDTGYSMPMIQKHAAPWNQGAVPKLQQIAKELFLTIVCGVSEREGVSLYNAQVIVDPTGGILAKYRKTHLVAAAPLDERSCFTAGDKFVSCKINPPKDGSAVADNFTLGLTICYDLRFPEICRKLAVEHGVNVFVASSAWPFVRIEHLRVLALARAMENQCYLILANRVGTDDGVTLCGSSAILDPHGTILAAAPPDREELIYADIRRQTLDLVRRGMAMFEHRRSDLY